MNPTMLLNEDIYLLNRILDFIPNIVTAIDNCNPATIQSVWKGWKKFRIW